MLPDKKIASRRNENDDEEPIDFPWLYFIGMNKLGFTYRQVGHMFFGFWIDLFEEYKKQYNFETKRGLYKIEEHPEDEPISSLDVL